MTQHTLRVNRPGCVVRYRCEWLSPPDTQSPMLRVIDIDQPDHTQTLPRESRQWFESENPIKIYPWDMRRLIAMEGVNCAFCFEPVDLNNMHPLSDQAKVPIFKNWFAAHYHCMHIGDPKVRVIEGKLQLVPENTEAVPVQNKQCCIKVL